MESKGFTLLEILVAVGIFAVLTGVVLFDVSNYQNKSRNATITANLSTVITSSSVWLLQNPNFDAFFSDPSYTVPIAAAEAAYGGASIKALNSPTNSTSFCTCIGLRQTIGAPSLTSLCIDSNGSRSITTNPCLIRCGNAFINPAQRGVCLP